MVRILNSLSFSFCFWMIPLFGSLLRTHFLFFSTNFSRFDEPQYPDDFGEVLNEVKVYRCEISQKRVIISNGILGPVAENEMIDLTCDTVGGNVNFKDHAVI